MRPVDAHCHIYFEQFDGDREEVIERAREKLEFIGVPGVNPQTNAEVLELVDRYGDFIVPNLGLHPTYTESFSEVEKVVSQVKENDPAAIGEIGLDHHHVTDGEKRGTQEEVFRKMLEVAEKLGKPVAVHSREAEEKAFRIIEEYDLPEVFMHCFNGSPDLAEKAADAGMKIGVTTQVLYSSRVQNIVERLDVEDMVLETDSPYLYRGKRNEPTNVLESMEKIARIKELEEDEVRSATTENSRKIFGR